MDSLINCQSIHFYIDKISLIFGEIYFLKKLTHTYSKKQI